MHPHLPNLFIQLPTEDQKLTRGNLGLLISFLRQSPLRVTRLIGNKRYLFYSTSLLISKDYGKPIICRHRDEEFRYCGAGYRVDGIFSRRVITRRKPVLMWFFIIRQTLPYAPHTIVEDMVNHMVSHSSTSCILKYYLFVATVDSHRYSSTRRSSFSFQIKLKIRSISIFTKN